MKKLLQLVLIFSGIFLISLKSLSQDLNSNSSELQTPSSNFIYTNDKLSSQFSLNLRGYLAYRQYQTYEDVVTTNPYWRRDADLATFEFRGDFDLNSISSLEFEIEFEHGGTGSTNEFEPLEEFGEFGTETEKGGEVNLSELYYKRVIGQGQLFNLPVRSQIRAGKLPVFMSLGNVQENYFKYSTVLSSSAEQYMIPLEWRELGLEYQIYFQDQNNNDIFNIKASLITGLNSEFFRKYNWVGGGYQKRFETSNAGSLASVLAIEYGDVKNSDGLALAYYWGEVSNNRYKQRKLSDNARLDILSVFGVYDLNNFIIRGQFITGNLENSAEISAANTSLSGSANPGAYSSLGKKAQLEMVEIGYAFFKDTTSKFQPYYSYQHVNTFKEVEGSIIADDRFNQTISSFGFIKQWDQVMLIKFEYSKNSNALDVLPSTETYQLALGFDWAGLKNN